MKYKAGDRVKIKSLDWYNENKTKHGDIWFDNAVFTGGQSLYCGCELTIRLITDDRYYVIENDYYWTDEMIEGLVEEEIGLVDNLSSRWVNEFNLPDGYIFKDENGNVINATKIVLEKKKEYPKTYEECCKVLGLNHYLGLSWNSYDVYSGVISSLPKRIEDIAKKLESLSKILICRDAYWKLYGDEMGLGKPWEPPYGCEPIDTFCLQVYQDRITKVTDNTLNHCILTFPTPEMQDAFKENFKEEIESCKELL